MSFFEAMAPVLAGLGLFFIGTRFMAANLAALASGSARKLIRRTLGSQPLAAVGGLLAGVVTQSPNSVAQMMVSLARTGIASGRSGALVTVWSNVGASALVILVAFNTNIGAAYLLAIVGTALYLDLKVSDQARQALLAALGVGLLLLGLGMLKGSSGQLRESFVQHNILQSGGPAIVTLLVGAAMAVATQSSTVASATAVALFRSGFFDVSTTLLLIAGASGGNGLNYAFQARRGHSDGRHVLLFQAAQKLFGTVALLIPILLWPHTMSASVSSLPFDRSGQIAWVFLATQLCGTVACTLLMGPLSDLFARIAPARHEERLGRPAFLIEESLGDAALALDLAKRELQRVAQRLPMMLERVRADGDATAISHDVLLAASRDVAVELRRYMADIMDHRPDYGTIVQVMELQQGLSNVMLMLEAVSEFVVAAQMVLAADPDNTTVDHIVESLHLILEVLVEAIEEGASTEQEMALKLLRQRSELLEGIRTKMLADSASAETQLVEAQFQITIVFERILWLGEATLKILLHGPDPQAAVTPPSERRAAEAGRISHDAWPD